MEHIQRIEAQLTRNNYAAVLVAIMAVLIATFLLTFTFKAKKRNNILIAGPSGAGKTSIFLRLRYGKTELSTYTSMKENVYTGILADCASSKPKTLVDFPGHPRLSGGLVDYLAKARGIIFVIDAATLARNLRNVTDYLYGILAEPIVRKQKTPILIVCNKTDLVTALKEAKAKILLEDEIARLRTTRSAAHDAVGGDVQEDSYLGFEGEDFKFDHLENPIEFASCSVVNDNIEAVTEWIG